MIGKTQTMSPQRTLGAIALAGAIVITACAGGIPVLVGASRCEGGEGGGDKQKRRQEGRAAGIHDRMAKLRREYGFVRMRVNQNGLA